MGGALTAVSPGLHPGSTQRGGDELLGAAAALGRLRRVRPVRRAGLPGRALPPAVPDLIQMLWDRGEPNGYAHRMTEHPLPEHPAPQGADERRARRPPGDSNFQADVEARTIGASHPRPRSSTRAAGPTSTCSGTSRRSHSYPFDGSAVIYCDIGPGATQPRRPRRRRSACRRRPGPTRPNRGGEDPHGAPRGAPTGLQHDLRFPGAQRRGHQPLWRAVPAIRVATPVHDPGGRGIAVIRFGHFGRGGETGMGAVRETGRQGVRTTATAALAVAVAAVAASPAIAKPVARKEAFGGDPICPAGRPGHRRRP